jgi:hypothetical protein
LNWPRSADRSVVARVRVARSGLAIAQRRLGGDIVAVDLGDGAPLPLAGLEAAGAEPTDHGAVTLCQGLGDVFGPVAPDVHDLAIPGSRANADHLIIGPSGVFLIDSQALPRSAHPHPEG